MPVVLREFEDTQIKLTVEEIDGFNFIATRQYKNRIPSDSRTVHRFETVGGAMEKMLELMIDYYEEVVGHGGLLG